MLSFFYKNINNPKLEIRFVLVVKSSEIESLTGTVQIMDILQKIYPQRSVIITGVKHKLLSVVGLEAMQPDITKSWTEQEISIQ